jgi:hypothetical protein
MDTLDRIDKLQKEVDAIKDLFLSLTSLVKKSNTPKNKKNDKESKSTK